MASSRGRKRSECPPQKISAMRNSSLAGVFGKRRATRMSASQLINGRLQDVRRPWTKDSEETIFRGHHRSPRKAGVKQTWNAIKRGRKTSPDLTLERFECNESKRSTGCAVLRCGLGRDRGTLPPPLAALDLGFRDSFVGVRFVLKAPECSAIEASFSAAP